MGPKKKETFGENQWRRIIEETPLNGDNFNVKVVLMECAGSEQDRIYLSKFESFAAEERRFVIKNICKTETIFMINQLGGEKKVKDESLRVFEEGQTYLKDKKDIPADVQALIIKHLILKMKDEYIFIKRQKLEVKEGIRRESATMINKTEVRGTVNIKPEPSPVVPTKGKGKKGEPESQFPEPDEGKKYNTTLRVRGEEWRDRVYVDDFPTDGPNLYVAITGFGEPLLPVCLIKIGIPLTSIVQIRIDVVANKVPSTLFRTTKRGQSQTEILMEKSLKFWEDVQQIRIHKDYADYFKSTAFIIFYPPYWESESLSGTPDKIYDELCYFMYDIQDLSRQHAHYLDNMDCTHVPEEGKENIYVKYYNQQIDDLPLECVTIYSVLDGIIQTVSKCQTSENNSRSSLSTALSQAEYITKSNMDNKKELAKGLVKNVFSTLRKSEVNEESYRITHGEEYEHHEDPIVITYGDFSKYPTFHLGNINLDYIVGSTLFGMPINNLWQNQDCPEGEIEAKISYHVNVLLSCFEREDVETAELKRLMHILACRKLYNNRSSLKKQHLPSSTITEFKKVYLKRSILAEPLSKCPPQFQYCNVKSPSFPSITKSENTSNTSYGQDAEVSTIKYLFDCPDISELVSAAEIANDKPIDHMIDNFEFFEDFTGTSAFQILLDAYNKFNCLDYKYCEVTDCMILMFFNSHDRDGISREEWRCHLPTPLCLQDYFDFILDEHYNWIQNEEKRYDERMAMRAHSECQVSIEPFVMSTCLDNTEDDVELLMEGSLKHQEIVQVEEASPVSSEKTLTKKSVPSPISTEIDSKSSRKTKSPATSTPKNKHQINLSGDISDTSIVKVKKPFCGYDLGDRRVEVFGKDSTFFSRDGSKVSTMYTLLIPMNLEYIILNPTPGNGNNEFWIHRALGEFVTPDTLDYCNSFRITSKDQVMINIMKRIYRLPIVTSVESNIINTKQKETVLKTLSQSARSPTMAEQFESKQFYSLYVTWPNGLVTETIHESNASDISHIKQQYLTPILDLDEDIRCISLNGEVIVFKKSGNIDVLRPDGAYFNISKYERKIVTPEGDDQHSETSSDKSKKEKGKDRNSKTSSKSSKFAESEDLKDLQAEYKLFIDEFEVIETNGLRQKWVNGVPFDIEKLLIRTAVDYCLGEVFSRRMDGTNILYNKDGIQIVTFPDKTRIITNYTIEDMEIYPEWTDEEREYFDMFVPDVIETDTAKCSMSQKSYLNSSIASTMSRKMEEEEFKEKERMDGYISVHVVYTIEHPNFTTITINKANGKISVDSPNNTSVTVDTFNNYELTLDSATTATFNGDNLHINYEACPKCRSCTTFDISIAHPETNSLTKMQRNWLKMKDSFCKNIVINEEGNISLVDEFFSQETLPTEEIYQSENNFGNYEPGGKSENFATTHSKCRDMYQAKTIRFFVLKRELTCSEILHRALVEQYKQACRWQPWCTINEYDTFGDHRSLLSILSPVNVTETEKWLMESKLAGKPLNLTFEDLKNDNGKGFYHWMRPYERFEPQPMKPENVILPRLPRAFIIRTLEQQWTDKDREELKGAKELLRAILRYRNVMAADCETLLHVPIIDPRSEDERRTEEKVQALGHRIYNDLKHRLQQDVEGRAKATITTKPRAEREDMSLQGEIDEEAEDELQALEEERVRLVNELEEAEPANPELQRYWRRRAEELKEEQFYQYLLREDNVPPYFRNLLGGAIWWDMNSTAGAAVTAAERKKTCACTGAEATSSNTGRQQSPR